MKTEKELFAAAESLYHGYSDSRYLEAIESFKVLLQNYPKNTQGWCMISTMQSCAKLYDDALESIDEAIKLDAENNSILSQKSTLLHEIDRLEFENNEYLDNNSNRAYIIKKFPQKENLTEEILVVCNEQIKTVRHDFYGLGDIIERKARALLSLKEWESSIEEYKKAIEFYKTHSDRTFLDPVASCFFCIAKIYEENKEFNSSIKYYDLAMEAEYEEIILTHKARVLKLKGDIKASETLFDEFIEIVANKFQNSKDFAYVFQIVNVYKERGMKKKALTILDEYRTSAKTDDGLNLRINQIREELLMK